MGIGSSLKKAIKKIIPKEVSAIAPIVAPFNPALAAGLGALGGYRDDGFSGALRGGLGSYALGQGARWLGGAGFQSNPFVEGGAFRGWGSGGLREGFSSPFGTKTGLGEFLSRDKTIPTKRTGVEAFELTEGGQSVIGADENIYDSISGELLSVDGQIGKELEKEIVSKGLGKSIADIFRQGFNKETTANLVQAALSKEGLPITLGAAAALVQYLENKEMEKNKIDLQVGAEPGYMTADRGTSPVFTNPNLSIGQYVKDGGIIGLAYGGEPTHEMDYRPGGFIPVGAQERADDVPARLSKNEFVMTADAVRAAGGGSVDVGAQRMYNLMNQLEGVA